MFPSSLTLYAIVPKYRFYDSTQKYLQAHNHYLSQLYRGLAGTVATLRVHNPRSNLCVTRGGR